MTHEQQEQLNHKFLGADLSNLDDMQVLKIAIEHAIKNGWENIEGVRPITVEGHIFLIKSYVPPNYFFDISELLFNPDFAKSLWGAQEGYILRAFTPHGSQLYGQEVPAFKYHLSRLAIESCRLEYIRNNLIV